MPFQILHLSDLHLDAALPALGPQRRADLRAALGRILALARERKVDAVTVAGDLYEQAYALPEIADFLAQQFARLAPIRVFIAPGERDPYTHDSLYALTRWPENVTLFTQGRLTPLELAPGIFLWGAACPPARGGRDLAGLRVDRAGVNLLLLHAADSAVPGDEALFTVDAAAVRAAGFDLALLGHQHGGRRSPEDAPVCIYPGSPEPLGLAEDAGGHHVALVTLHAGACAVDLLPVNRWRALALTVDLTACADVAEIAARVCAALRAAQADADARTLCTVTLTGAPDCAPDLAALREQVDVQARVRYEVQFTSPYDLERLAQEQTVRGLLVRRFQARLDRITNADERRRALTALTLALQALEGKQVQPYEIA